ncbi:MAG: hypothetical protein ACKOXQ_01920 [Hydrogenophaga sp.]
MKHPLVCIACLLPALGMAGVLASAKSRVPVVTEGSTVSPAPADVPPPRSRAALRDALRQPVDEGGHTPFRLSAQERQRMREQLRPSSWSDRPGS